MRPSVTWVLADTHFNDPECISYFNRPDDYQKKIISNCRYYIAPQDVLIHLGDVIYHNPGEIKEILESIPTKSKILVRGNHDKETDNWYLNHGFSFVCDQIIIKDLLLSHKPQNTHLRNLHGHWHNIPEEKIRKFEPEMLEFYDQNKHFLFCLEDLNYCPQPLTKWVK